MTSSTPHLPTRAFAGGNGRVLRSHLSTGPHTNIDNTDNTNLHVPDSGYVDIPVPIRNSNTSSADVDDPHNVNLPDSDAGAVNASATPPKREGYTLTLPATHALEFGRKRKLSDSYSKIDWSPTLPSKKHNSSSDEDTTDIVDVNRDGSPLSTLCSDSTGSDEDCSTPPLRTNNAISKLLDRKEICSDEQSSSQPVPNRSADQEHHKVDGSDCPSSQVFGITTNTDGGHHLKTIPAHSFTNPRNLGMWSKAVRDETSGATIYMVTYMLSSDPWTEQSIVDSIMDQDMIADGLYDGLPAYPKLQFVYNSTPPNIDVKELDEEGNIIRHVMSVEAWLSFGITKQQCIKCITFTHNGLNSNPARDTPLLFSAVSYNTDSKIKTFKDNAPKTQFYAIDRDTNRPVLFWSLGVITSVFLTQPCSESGRPIYRGVHAVLQRWERDRLGVFFSMLFRNIHLSVQIDGNSAYVYQTRFQSTANSQKPNNLDSYTSQQSQGVRIARFNIPTYRTPLKEIAPPSYFNRGYAYTAQIPTYDARGRDFDPMCIDSSLQALSPFVGEIPEGSTAFIGYGAGTSLYNDIWKITFYIRNLVILSTPV